MFFFFNELLLNFNDIYEYLIYYSVIPITKITNGLLVESGHNTEITGLNSKGGLTSSGLYSRTLLYNEYSSYMSIRVTPLGYS